MHFGSLWRTKMAATLQAGVCASARWCSPLRGRKFRGALATEQRLRDFFRERFDLGGEFLAVADDPFAVGQRQTDGAIAGAVADPDGRGDGAERRVALAEAERHAVDAGGAQLGEETPRVEIGVRRGDFVVGMGRVVGPDSLVELGDEDFAAGGIEGRAVVAEEKRVGGGPAGAEGKGGLAAKRGDDDGRAELAGLGAEQRFHGGVESELGGDQVKEPEDLRTDGVAARGVVLIDEAERAERGGEIVGGGFRELEGVGSCVMPRERWAFRSTVRASTPRSMEL